MSNPTFPGYCRVTAAIMLVLMGMGMHTAQKAVAQSKDIVWQAVVNGEREDLKMSGSMGIDSLGSATAKFVTSYKEKGFYLIKMDSVQVSDTARVPIRVTFFATSGPEVKVSTVNIVGTEVISEKEFLNDFKTRRGKVFSQSRLEEDIQFALLKYEESGYPFAQVEVDSIQVVNGKKEDLGLVVSLKIEEGSRVKINDIVLTGAKRTQVVYVEQLTGLRRGQWLKQNLDDVHQALIGSRYFSAVQSPQLIMVGDEDAVLQIPVREEAPGSFDLILGYQPASTSNTLGKSQGLVGSGHLVLRNMFGAGRQFALRLNRLPGQISTVKTSFYDPYIFRLPLSIEAGFDGVQQDSTFGQQQYRGAVGYRIGGGLEALLTISREVTKPGQAGLELVNGFQRVPQSEVVFAGLTLRYLRVDYPLSPQKGFLVETRFERGSKTGNGFQLVDGDTLSVRNVAQQERLTFTGRWFVSFFNKQVLVLGNDTRVLASDRYDIGDLFRFGGAQSLRGYDEDRFRGRLVSRSLVEYRYLFDRQSFAYLFFDLGYVDQPELTNQKANTDVYPGYGLGIQFETGIGLINTSIAISTQEDFSQARVHAGLSLGL